MFKRYRAPDGAQLRALFGTTRFPEGTGALVCSGTVAPVLRRNVGASSDVRASELIPAHFGVLSGNAAGGPSLRRAHVARFEAASDHPIFRAAWKRAQRCLVPAAWIGVTDRRSGEPVHTQLARVDGLPIGLAGLWTESESVDQQRITYFCVLTIAAKAHLLADRLIPNASRPRVPVILQERMFEAWLAATQDAEVLATGQLPVDLLVHTCEKESHRRESEALKQALTSGPWLVPSA